ncbi:hypothetical protein LXL04_038951 [Taraxacum kok-saghyz]
MVSICVANVKVDVEEKKGKPFVTESENSTLVILFKAHFEVLEAHPGLNNSVRKVFSLVPISGYHSGEAPTRLQLSDASATNSTPTRRPPAPCLCALRSSVTSVSRRTPLQRTPLHSNTVRRFLPYSRLYRMVRTMQMLDVIEDEYLEVFELNKLTY